MFFDKELSRFYQYARRENVDIEMAESNQIAMNMFKDESARSATYKLLELITDDVFLSLPQDPYDDIWRNYKELKFIFCGGCGLWAFSEECASKDLLLTKYNGYEKANEADFSKHFDSRHLGEAAEKFVNFSDILQKKYQYDYRLARLSAWILIEMVCYQKYYERWVENYDNNPQVIDDKAEYIRYCYKNYILKISDYHTKAILAYYLRYKEGDNKRKFRFLNIIQLIDRILSEEKEDEKYKNLEEMVFAPNGEDEQKAKKNIDIDDVDLMSGLEFESFTSLIFKKMGFETKTTKTTGDQGIDIIASKGVQRIGIQVKCYSGMVGNSAVQEVVAGIRYYNLIKGIVVTNSRYTASAIRLAEANNIILWDRTILIEKIHEYNKK